MKCPRCEREINEENQFCPYCGQRIVRRSNHVSKTMKEMRFRQISFVMNRILNIATIIAVIFAIIGVFGPVLEIEGASDNIQIGGLAWFTWHGWQKLNDGLISTGPFFLTFVLYILLFIGVLVIAPFAIYKAINGLRRKEECKTVPYIILLSIVHNIYTALINCFYYEFDRAGSAYYETGSSWGSVVYSLAIPLFTIGLVILYAMKAILTSPTSKRCVKYIFALICGLVTMSSFTSIFAVLGFQDLHIGESTVFGTLHYFDFISGMPFAVGALLVSAFILGLLYTGVSIAYGITTIRNLVKGDKVNRILILVFGIAQAAIIFILFVISIVFGAAVNLIEGWYNNIFYISTDFLALAFNSMVVLGFSIAIFALGEDKEVNDNIIDVKVESKDA